HRARGCNAGWAMHRAGRATRDQVQDMPLRLRELIDRVVPSAELAPSAADIALQLDHPVYDCFYLALAERREIELLTADRRLVRKAAGSPWQGWVRALEAD